MKGVEQISLNTPAGELSRNRGGGDGEKRKKHCELAVNILLGNQGRQEVDDDQGVEEGGVGWMKRFCFNYTVNMGNSVTVLAGYQSTKLVKIISVSGLMSVKTFY